MNTSAPFTLLSGAAAVLGACLACYGAGGSRWIGIVILLAGAALLALTAVEAKNRKKKMESLHDQLVDFLEGGLPSPRFSVDDDDFALFENITAWSRLKTRPAACRSLSASLCWRKSGKWANE